MNRLPEKLAEIVEDFSLCEGREKLEYLLQFSEQLPSLPEWVEAKRDEMDQVHECLTPVFIYLEKQDGKLFFHFDIPPEAPTVRGFAAVLQSGLAWVSAEQVQALPHEFYLQMGLQQVLSGQRLHGISAMLAHMKTLAS